MPRQVRPEKMLAAFRSVYFRLPDFSVSWYFCKPRQTAIGRPPQPFPELPGLLWTQELLTIHLDAGHRGAVRQSKLHKPIVPTIDKGFVFCGAFLATEHEGKKTTILDGMPARFLALFQA